MQEFDRLTRLDVRENQLLISGKKANQIEQIAGKLPCYVYDRKLIRQRVESLKQLLPEQIHLHYAIKANPMPALVCYMAELTDGLDVASHIELKKALATGIAPEKVSFAGPAKSESELRAAIASGVVLHVESELELARITKIAEVTACLAKVALRVNPDFEVKGSGMKMSGGAKPFGIDAECCEQIIRGIKSKYVQFVGLHIFSGSQNLNIESLLEAYKKTILLAASICQQADVKPQQVNIGGGLGIPYFPGDKALDIQLLCAELKQIIDQLPTNLSQAQIHIELGRYLVAEAGTYLCQITDKKESRGKTFLMTNGGMHHHLANSGNFGQVIRRNYPVVIANKVAADKFQEVEICGPLCTPLDIVAAKVSLPTAEVGDYVAVLQSGAYGASASPQEFLGHQRVEELLL